MNVKKVTLIITFAAVAITLNTVRVPTIFYPSNYFQFSQIPIVIAFLLFGTRIGISIGAVNLMVSIMILPFSSTSIVTYTMDFLSLLPMFAGLKLAQKFTSQNEKMGEFSIKKKPIIRLIAFPTAFRAMTMPILDYGFVFHFVLPLFFGINLSGAAIAALVPSFVLYNIIVPFYTIPVAYIVTKKISGSVRLSASAIL